MSARETQQEKMRLALQWAASDKGEKGELKEADDQDPLNRVARKEEELAEDSHHQEETPDQERDGQLVDNDLHYS